MHDGFNVTQVNDKASLALNGELVAKFSHHRSHREIGGRVKLQKGATYLLLIGRHFIDEEFDFRLRTFSYGAYSIS